MKLEELKLKFQEVLLVKMALDLIKRVESIIEETRSGSEIYSHNIRLKFESCSDMGIAKSTLKRKYDNQFIITTEIQPSLVEDPDNETNFYVLMTPKTRGKD